MFRGIVRVRVYDDAVVALAGVVVGDRDCRGGDFCQICVINI